MGIVNKYFSINLVAFFVGGILMLVLSKSSNNIEIKALKQKNDSLLLANKDLRKLSDSINYNIQQSSLVIESLNKKDELLKYKVSQLNNKIQLLNKKYEKATNYANNFNSVDIQRYFSELK